MTAIRVEVVYALPHSVDAVTVRLRPGATAADAIRAAGTLERHAEIDATAFKLGIFGSPVKIDTALQDGDRVEIYRALQLDPKEARRRRARGRF